MACVYFIYNLNTDKVYVGLTRRGLAVRWREHRKYARRGSNSPIHKSIRKHGEISFVLGILEECSSENVPNREEFWIAALGTIRPGGYNLTRGGEGHTKPLSEETKRKISVANTGNKNCLGRRLSEATKRKISEAHLRLPKYTPEERKAARRESSRRYKQKHK